MKKALIFVEAKDGKLKKGSLEALSLVQSGGFETVACALGTGADQLSGELSKWGVTKLYHCSDAKTDSFNPEIYQAVLQEAISKEQPSVMIASSNSHARDIFPRLAAKNDMAYMSDLTDVNLEQDLFKRPMYAGKCNAHVSFLGDSAKIILLRPNQIAVVDATGSSSVEAIAVALPETSGANETTAVEAGQSEKLDLTEADKIVSGGRGLKEAENFKLLEELAAPMNATVGASRAVVDLGWVPHSLQVGQTGKTVAPSLYIAAGISGAIQHLAGMSGSKNIVAINKDDKAPIFQKSTYGIVGDLFEVVPKLTEKLKSTL